MIDEDVLQFLYIIYVIIGIVFLFVFIGVFLINALSPTNESATTTTITTTTTIPIIAFPEKTEKDIILEIVKNATEGMRWTMHEVGYERYNCADFVADAVLLLREHNYTAYPVCGWLYHNYHAWVGLEFNGSFYNIEPQSGEIVYPTDLEYVRGRRCVVRGVV